MTSLRHHINRFAFPGGSAIIRLPTFTKHRLCWTVQTNNITHQCRLPLSAFSVFVKISRERLLLPVCHSVDLIDLPPRFSKPAIVKHIYVSDPTKTCCWLDVKRSMSKQGLARDLLLITLTGTNLRISLLKSCSKYPCALGFPYNLIIRQWISRTTATQNSLSQHRI